MEEVETTESAEGASADVDVDALMARIDAGEEINPGYERESGDAPRETAPPEAAQSQTVDQNTFELNGQRMTREQVLELAKNGFDFQSKQEAFAKSQQEFEARQQSLKRYEEIDQFAAKNPDWWNHVTQNYQKAQEPQVPEIPEELKAHLEPILKDYREMKSFISDYQRQQIETKNRQADSQYKETLSTLGKTYGVDFNATDATGQTLERRVLAHAQARGISNMEAAYRDYDFANIVARSEAAGREAVANEHKKNQKLGLLKGAPPAPSFDFDFTPNQGEESPTHGRSWSNAYEGALEDLRTLQRA